MASALQKMQELSVVVWLKIRKHDIGNSPTRFDDIVVVWLKIRKHDIELLQVIR